ncbi:MAG: NUDIX hydrolase [Chloroflexota bacterium]
MGPDSERTLLRVDRDLAYLPRPNIVSLYLSDALPPSKLITSAFALAFDGDCILMTRLRHRGWDIPGGHVEPGESPEQTMRRETLEETGAALGRACPFGHLRMEVLAPKPERYRYPYPVSYQVLFLTRVVDCTTFQASKEASERALIPPNEAPSIRWIARNQELYNAAVKAIRGLRPSCR